MSHPLFSLWQSGEGIRGVGNPNLIEVPLTAFFASRQCPGNAIRAALDWAMEQSRHRTPLIGGFQSPLERSVLEVVLAARSPVVIVLARNLEHARIPSAWRAGIEANQVTVVSMADARLSATLAQRRNQWIANHARHIVLGYAQPAGRLVRQAERWRQEGRSIQVLHPKSGERGDEVVIFGAGKQREG